MLVIGELISRSIRVNFLENIDNPNITQVVDQAIAANNTRTLPDMNNFGESEEGGSTNIFEIIFDLGKTLIKWSFKAIKWLGITVSAAYSWLINTWTQIWNFNWNSTDQALQNSINSYNQQLYGIWGGVFGKFALGYLPMVVIGTGIGLVFPVIGGSTLAKMLVGELSKEILDEIADELGSAITQTIDIWATQGVIAAYINTRKWIKKLPKTTLDTLVGSANSDWIKNVWGEPTAPSLSFSGNLEDAIEDIDNINYQSFIEEALEEGWDTFVEGGYIIANKLDEAIFMYEAANQRSNGVNRSIAIYPDGNSDEEFLILEDIPQSQAITTTQLLINQHRLIGNRSVGNIVAQSFDEPQAPRPLLRKLTIEFSSRPQPPWIHEDGKPAKRIFVSIPDIRIGTTIKQVKKAAKFYQWGQFRAIARLTNKRNMIVHGGTQEIALAKLKEFLDLTDTEVQSIMVTEEKEVPLKSKKQPILIYPKTARILYRKNSLDNNGNVVINNQYFDTEYTQWTLWTENELEDNQVIN